MDGRRASRLAPPRPVVRFRCAYTEGADPFFDHRHYAREIRTRITRAARVASRHGR